MENTTNPNSYYAKYRDYFEFHDWGNYYDYFIEIVNANDNRDWPLDECPVCECDFTENKPVKKYFKLESTLFVVITGLILVGILFYISAYILAALTVISDSLFYIGGSIVLILAVVVMFAANKSKKIHLYYCPKCSSLIYNEILEHPVKSKLHPNVFLPKIEKLGEIRFKA